MPRESRRTRFVCISDTHNAAPNSSFKLPAGDVLIHAGDLTNDGRYTELRKTLEWIEKADFEVKIVIAGNHDITLDNHFYKQYGGYFHAQHRQDPAACLELISQFPSIIYLNHGMAEINLLKDDGPRTTFKVFGSPYSPARGLWAFGYPHENAEQLWNQIPLEVDVVVTHTPPKYHCDESRGRGAAGCEALREALWRVRPSLAVCGHIHEGRGVERVVWDLASKNVRFKEHDTGYWIDPGAGNKKQSLVDLTSRGFEPLQNSDTEVMDENSRQVPSWITKPHSPLTIPWKWKLRSQMTALDTVNPTPAPEPEVEGDLTTIQDAGVSVVFKNPITPPSKDTHSLSQGIGGNPTSARSDMEALAGRLGRKETCIVNAAMIATSWPHKAVNGSKYNKPLVVDVNLPAWDTKP